jgi:hypothetical protein
MAMTSDEHYLPAQDGDHAFVFYGQPLNRRLKCMPLYVVNLPSGQATEQVQTVIETVCDALSRHGVNIKYVCADGDPGHNQRHFFLEWYPILIESGLAAVLGFLLEAKMIPVSDCLHLWKKYLNKIKNHPVTWNPDSFDAVLDAENLESILQLGLALLDKSSVGRMRDSYALQLFSYANCLKCRESNYI